MKSWLLLMKPNHKSKQIDVLLDVALDNQYLNSSLIMDLSSLILYKIIFLYHSLVTNSSNPKPLNTHWTDLIPAGEHRNSLRQSRIQHTFFLFHSRVYVSPG
jgi:hypothetical protein